MALPDNASSLFPLPAPFVGGRSYPVTPKVDYETGGVALDDSSEGLQYQVWRARVLEDEDTGEDYVMLNAEEIEEFEILRGNKITQFSFAFDRNMRLHYTWVEQGVAYFRWYDTQISDMRVDTLGPQYKTPRLAHDDKRDLQSDIADVILAYLYEYQTDFQCSAPQTLSQIPDEDFPVYSARGCQITMEYVFMDTRRYWQDCDGTQTQLHGSSGAYRLADSSTFQTGGSGVQSLYGYQVVPIMGPATCQRTARDLRYVQQRDRYQIERTLVEDVESPGMVKIGMNRQLRFQFQLEVAR